MQTADEKLFKEEIHLVINFETITWEQLLDFCERKREDIQSLFGEMGDFHVAVHVDTHYEPALKDNYDDADIPAGPCPEIDTLLGPPEGDQ